MNKRVTRLIAPLLLLAFQQPSLAQEASSQELVVIDLRPKEEKDGIGLLELTGKCNKDVFRIADVATDPVKVEVLRAGLAEQLGLASDGKTLTVLNWSVYYNKQKAGGSFLEGVGVQGYNLPGKKKRGRGRQQMLPEGIGRRLVPGQRSDDHRPADHLGVRRNVRRQTLQRARGSLRSPENRREVQGRRGRHRGIARRP